MKVKELKAILALLKDRDDDLEVVIPIEKKGVLLGVSPHVKITTVGRGFDWNPHLFFIYPERKLIDVVTND